MPNTMPTLCMDGFVSVNICDLRRAENRTALVHASVLKTTVYKHLSTGIKQEGSKSKTGRQRGNKDYESAALTIELRARMTILHYRKCGRGLGGTKWPGPRLTFVEVSLTERHLRKDELGHIPRVRDRAKQEYPRCCRHATIAAISTALHQQRCDMTQTRAGAARSDFAGPIARGGCNVIPQ
jgi:hypothetical protein